MTLSIFMGFGYQNHMKILHILSQMPDYTGSGKYVQEMIRQSRAKHHAPFLIAGVAADFEVPRPRYSLVQE